MNIKNKIKIFLNKLWKNRNNKQRSFIAVVLVPTLIATFYYSLIAADLYVVESRFSVKGNEMQQFDMLSGIAGIPSQGGSATDSYILQEYINSHQVVSAVSQSIDLSSVFNHEAADWVSSLGYDKTREDVVNYWRKRVTVSFDPTTTIITLKVRAFTPEEAERLSQEIIKQSEILINALSERAREDDLSFAEAEVARAELRVTAARLSMNTFRNQVQDLDPTQTATAKMTIIAELESQLTAAQAELKVMQGYMNESAPAVTNLKRKITALIAQIDKERDGIAGKSSEGSALSGVFADYEPLLVEREFAEKAYTSSLASLEAARVEAARKHRYLATFVAPSSPDEALEPNRIKSIATVFLGALIAWAIGLLGLGVVRDHVGWV
ncbi:Chromosome partition protein Smc [Grimontia celer]|uniref:Chromosome partition protein Smc n=1 Tax=Grimontia celer TaxID=1796497 RepID=A0A128F0S0_9GAMM|nr:capsule biosynthesis protein [Grimontia celer]CZF80145.1 Chromosome partition protein Smc [Grimontia celer]